jgi:hypothetical protein
LPKVCGHFDSSWEGTRAEKGWGEVHRSVKKLPNSKILLGTMINPDTNDCGVSRGAISRNYEGVGKNPSVYPFFEQLFGSMLLGHGLSFQRDCGKCAGLA